MRSFIVVLVFFLCADCIAQHRLAIVHVNVVNVAKPNELSQDQTVIINAGKITRIGPSASTKVPAGFTLIEGNGKFLIPGLWDMRTHLTKYGVEAFPLLIANGVTSVRDVDSDVQQVDQWIADIKAGKMIGPMILRNDTTARVKPMEHIESLSGAEADSVFIRIRKTRKYYDPRRSLPLITKLHKARVSLITGSDFGNKQAGIIPGKDLHVTLELFVKAGLTPGEAIRAATINAAKCMGVESKVGSINEGQVANLVLLDADPLKDITNTRKISKVILNGKIQ